MRTTSSLVAALEQQEASGDWEPVNAQTVLTVKGLHEKIEAFESLDFPAGRSAAHFLKTEAVHPGASVITMALTTSDRVEGFVSTNFTDVQITRDGAANIGVTFRRRLPAFRLAWIAKHRDTEVKGLELFAAAYGRALDAACCGGLVAFVLDPADPEVAELWKREPYCFEETDSKPNDQGVRPLWLPLRFGNSPNGLDEHEPNSV